MREIEEGLHKVHAMARENPKESNVEDMDTSPGILICHSFQGLQDI